MGSKRSPVLTVWGQLCDNHSKNALKLLQTKCLVKNVAGVQLPHTITEKNKHKNFDFVILLSSSSSSRVTEKP